jgi:hypothetical protein
LRERADLLASVLSPMLLVKHAPHRRVPQRGRLHVRGTRRPQRRIHEAYYGRPEALLDPAARLSCSAWSFVGAAVHERFTRDLSRDLADGTWGRHYGRLRTQPAFDGSLILVTSQP